MPAQKNNKHALGNDGGAPTKYKPEYNNQAYRLCLLGFNDKELAKYFDVDTGTINNWKKDYKEFFNSVTSGKEIADANIAESFYKRAKGYDFEEVTFEKIDVKGNLEVTPNELITTDAYKKKIVLKHLPPDAGAALNWLKNRQKDKWRDKQSFEFDLEQFSDEQLEMIVNKILEKSQKNEQ